MSWVETTSPSFSARHEERDGDDAVSVLELLEGTRERLAGAFAALPAEVAVILHSSVKQVALAQPPLPVVWLLTAPAGRRYLAGWISAREVHVLAPRLLAQRASSVGGSREMLMLTPAALYAQLVIGANNPRLPPPFSPRRFATYVRWAWLAAGAGQYFSGQTVYARPAIARRLREGRTPPFPPTVADAWLLGGSVFDLLASERGEAAAVDLATSALRGGAREALRHAFAGRPLTETEAVWRAHLGHIAEP
jgi:hypothetical protein